MDSVHFSNDEERTMLRDSVRGLLSEHWPAEKAQSFAGDSDRQKDIWRVLSEQGYSALCSKESGTGLREALIVMSELGRAACPAPVLDAVMLNLFLGQESRVAELLSAVHAGKAFVCLSFAGSDPDRSVGGITGANGRFSGNVGFIDAASCATHLAFVVDEGATTLSVKITWVIPPGRRRLENCQPPRVVEGATALAACPNGRAVRRDRDCQQ